jgi:hypothetical protein
MATQAGSISVGSIQLGPDDGSTCPSAVGPAGSSEMVVFLVWPWILKCAIFIFTSYVMFNFNRSFHKVGYFEKSETCVIFLIVFAFITPMIYF